MNVGCFKVVLPILGTVCIGLALSTRFSSTLLTIFTAYAAPMAAYIMAWVMSCSDAIIYCFLMRLPYLSLPGFHLLIYFMWDFLPFTSDTMQCYSSWRMVMPLVVSNYVIYYTCLARFMYLTVYVQVCVYIQLWYYRLCMWTWYVSMCAIGC